MLTLVVARYNEDVSWVNLIPANVVIVNKAQVGNWGRETSSYLWFLAQHYHALKGEYLFCQGDPFVHCPDFVARVTLLLEEERRPQLPESNWAEFGPQCECDWEGAPHHPGLPLREGWEAVQSRIVRTMTKPETLRFTSGAQFLRSASEIHRALHKVEAAALLNLVKQREDLQLPWVMERLWRFVIPKAVE